MGRGDDARTMIQKLQEHVQKEGVGRYEIALIYAGLGEKDAAFEWLEKAFEQRTVYMLWLNVDPSFDDLRSDSRFEDLLRRIGCEHPHLS